MVILTDANAVRASSEMDINANLDSLVAKTDQFAIRMPSAYTTISTRTMSANAIMDSLVMDTSVIQFRFTKEII